MRRGLIYLTSLPFQPLPGKYMKEIKQNSFEFSMETIFSLWAIENSKWKISVTASQWVLSLKGLPGGGGGGADCP